MSEEQLQIVLRKGEATVQLDGAVGAVTAQLNALIAGGLGRLNEFFDGVGVPAGHGGPAPGTGTGPAEPAPTPGESLAPLSDVARSLSFIVDSISLPHSRSDHAVDLDGDGAPDNQLASIVSALMAQAIDVQSSIDSGLATAAEVIVLQVDTERDDLRSDQRADVTIAMGNRAEGGTNTIGPVAKLCGRLAGGRFEASLPGLAAATIELPIPSFGGGSRRLPLRAAAIAFDLASDESRLSDGRLSGAVDGNAVLAIVAPLLAAQFTAILTDQAESDTAKNITALLDRGGVAPDGSVSQAGDGVVDATEVMSSPLVRALLTADIRLADTGARAHQWRTRRGTGSPSGLDSQPDSPRSDAQKSRRNVQDPSGRSSGMSAGPGRRASTDGAQRRRADDDR